MKARLKYLVPGMLLVVLQVLPWALGAPASNFNAVALAIGILILLNLLFNAYRREERLHEEHAHSLQRELQFYVYARKILNAQTAAIAHLQALLHRRSRR